MKITVLDGYAANPGDISWKEIEDLGELTVLDRTAPCDIIEKAKDTEILLTNKCSITDEIISALPRLKYIGELATGFNNIDVKSAARHGVAVANIPAYSTESVVQHVFAFMLEIASSVGVHSEAVLSGKWQTNPDFCFWINPLVEISGKKLGIIGNGKIGSRVAEVGRAFGMDVTAYSPSKCDKSVLDKIIEQSDVISLNCPLKPDNAGMINKETISRMKKGVWLINTARGGLVDEQAIADALKESRIGWYAADVVTHEPINADSPLLTAPHVYLTPHIAWAPYEARIRLMHIAAENIKAFLNGERLNRVEG